MSFFEELTRSGWVVWPLLVLAPLGLLAGAVALAIRDRRARYRAGLASLIVAAAASFLGAGGALSSRARGDAIARSVEGKVAATRASRASYLSARLPLRLGLGVAMIPLLGGLSAAFSASRTRRQAQGAAMSRRAPSTRRMNGPRSRLGGQPGGSFGVAVGLAAVAGVGVVLTAALLVSPPPGPNLAVESPAWDALEGVELMESGSLSRGCERIEDASGKGHIEPARFPEVSSAVSTCFEYRFDEAISAEPPHREALLSSLAHSSLPYSASDKKRLEREIGRNP